MTLPPEALGGPRHHVRRPSAGARSFETLTRNQPDDKEQQLWI
jgi:hypothetical protein